MRVTFAEAPPGLGVAVVALAGVRSLRVDTIAVLALAGHAALVDVCQFGGEPEGRARGGESDHCARQEGPLNFIGWRRQKEEPLGNCASHRRGFGGPSHLDRTSCPG